MNKTYQLSLVILIIAFLSCQSDSKVEAEEPLSEKTFTPIATIDPQIYFATPENIAKDPNNALTDMFRKKKKADMANPEKPRPFEEKDMTAIENVSHLQDWADLESIFNFNWEKIGEEAKTELSEAIKARMIFDNPDLKVVEMAIAGGGVLPLHAQATPSVYHILGGTAEVISGDSMSVVGIGTSIKFDSYTPKRVKVTSKDPIKILWFSWAPEGNESYLESGYYLTGSNVHIQPIEAVLPIDFDFWNEVNSSSFELASTTPLSNAEDRDFIKVQKENWNNLEKQAYYPNMPSFRNESEVDWVDVVNLDPKSFFFAKDIQKLGSALKMLGRIAKIKSVFRVKRPQGGYDLNYSYLAWGPQSKYVTHSHAICEFYYVLEGDVEYIINKEAYHAVPGNFYFHPPYYDHEMLGLQKDVPFLSISGTWIPFGKRALFEKEFLLLEAGEQPESIQFPNDFDFHNFEMKKGLKYGVL